MTTPDSTSATSTTDRRALLADALGKLSQAGFVQHTKPVQGVILMERAWEGPDENSAIVDSITIHIRDEAIAVREGDGDGVPTWGPKRGPWPDIVAALLALPQPDKFVMAPAITTSKPAVELLGG